MNKQLCTLVKFTALILHLGMTGVALAASDPLANLRREHPRLMVLDDQIHADQALIQSDPIASDTLHRLKQQADKMIDQSPSQHVLVGPRLLAQSRNALKVISTCGGLYRLTGETKYADRARTEMLAVAGFADWNPSHFLDVAEMTNACGIGYDWIYDRLSIQDRQTIRQAIIDKGLKPGLAAYDAHAFWTDCSFNWGQVCAGGLTVGALAIADEEPQLARQILELTRATITRPMEQFTPDGGWEEGPGYWNYATSYNVFYLAAIETALGTDFDLDRTPGFALTGLFHLQLTGPTRKTFNFADAGDGSEPAPQMFWLARKFNHSEYAAWERAASSGRFNIFHLLWFNPQGQWPPRQELPLNAFFTRINVGFFRSSWTDSNAWYIGFKGGDNAANHSHLDLGSFVFDALGQRWATDMGPDDYNLPGYFQKQRFTYYRLTTAAHNVITLGGANQNSTATAKITEFNSSPLQSSAVIDLSAAYGAGNSVRRMISLIDRKRLLLQDQIKTDTAGPVEWNFHTPAEVRVNGAEAILSQHGVQLRVTLISPAGAKFETALCNPPAPQKPNPGISNLLVRSHGSTQFTVLFRAMDDSVLPVFKEIP